MNDATLPCDILAVQELEVNLHSAASFVEAMRHFGIHVFFCYAENDVYRTAVLSKLPGRRMELPDVQTNRLACASFEFVVCGDYVKVLVASYYGCAHDRQVAVDGATDAIRALRRSGYEWVMLGDFNVDQQEELMARTVGGGLAWSWDEPFMHESSLPGTRSSGRRLDYALGCGRLTPRTVDLMWCFSDHAMVSYEVDLTEPRGCAFPCGCSLAALLWMRLRGELFGIRLALRHRLRLRISTGRGPCSLNASEAVLAEGGGGR